MTFLQRLTTGIDLAKDSFRLLNDHKNLMVYALIPAAIMAGLEFIALTVPNMIDNGAQSIILPEGTSFLTKLSASKPLLATALFLIVFAALLATIFFDACLVYQASHIIRTQTTSARKTLLACLQKWTLIVQWALLIPLALTLVGVLGRLLYLLAMSHPGAAHQPSSLFMQGVLGFASILLTFAAVSAAAVVLVVTYAASYLVVPLIALQNVSLPRAIAISWTTVKRHIIELLGGLLVIYGIAKLAALLFMLPALLLAALPLGMLIMSILKFLFGIVIGAVLLIFKAFFYDKYYEQPYENVVLAEHDLMF